MSSNNTKSSCVRLVLSESMFIHNLSQHLYLPLLQTTLFICWEDIEHCITFIPLVHIAPHVWNIDCNNIHWILDFEMIQDLCALCAWVFLSYTHERCKSSASHSSTLFVIRNMKPRDLYNYSLIQEHIDVSLDKCITKSTFTICTQYYIWPWK